MNNRHRRVAKLKHQQDSYSDKQLGITADQAAKLYRELSLSMSNVLSNVGHAFINAANNIKGAMK